MSINVKPRDSRKAKTSILFQIKHNNSSENNIEVGQSINIISLNTPAKNNKRNGSQNSNQKVDSSLNNHNMNNQKIQAKRAHQSGKITIKLNSGVNIAEQDNKIISMHNAPTLKKIQINEVIQRYARKQLIYVQKNKIQTDVLSFTNICNQFLQKIDNLQLENMLYLGKIKKFEAYFKELRPKENTQNNEIIFDLQIGNKNEKNQQLKILNLERKVETLSYIIKNYRSNNKQEIKQFQKKIHEYKPTIQEQLTQMLMEANKKNQQNQKLVDFFQKQCQKYYKNGNWVEIARDLKQKNQQIQKLNKYREALTSQNRLFKEQIQANKVFKQYSERLNKQLIELRIQNDEIKIKLKQMEQLKLLKDIQFEQLNRTKQELWYKYEALITLQAKIKQKEQIIRKNSQIINRIQNQNLTLKNKIGVLVKNSQKQIFNKESGIQTIQKCSSNIQELTSRFAEQIEGFPEVNKELTSFIMHLYEKTKISFQKIVDQYNWQLQSTFLQNKELKNRLNTMTGNSKKKYQICQQIIIDIQNIGNKRKRCLESMERIENRQSCSSCNNWVLHWGQLNNLFEQLEILVKRLRQVE